MGQFPRVFERTLFNPFAACLIGLRPRDWDHLAHDMTSPEGNRRDEVAWRSSRHASSPRAQPNDAVTEGSGSSPSSDQAGASPPSPAGHPLKRSPVPAEPPFAFGPRLAVARLDPKPISGSPGLFSVEPSVPAPLVNPSLNPFAPLSISTLRTGSAPEPFLQIVRGRRVGQRIRLTVR